MVKSRRYPFFILLFALIHLCQSSKTYTIEMVDGVKTVHNLKAKWGEEPRLKLESVRHIGGIETDDTHLNQPMGVTRDTEGNLYILDHGDDDIKVYDVAGNYVETIGKKGQGPGEFDMAFYLGFDQTGNLYTLEASSRVQLFNKEGEYLREFRSPVRGTTFMALDDTHFVTSHFHTTDNGTNLVQIVSREGDLITEFCRPVDYGDATASRYGNNIKFCLESEHIYVAFRSQNRFEKYNRAGQLLLTSDRPLNYDIYFEHGGTRKLDVGGRVYELPEYNYSNVTRSMGMDHQNRIWLLTFLKQPAEGDHEKEDWSEFWEFEVFDTEGVLLTRVDCPGVHFDNLRIIGDRIYFNDPYNMGCVHVYKIVDL